MAIKVNLDASTSTTKMLLISRRSLQEGASGLDRCDVTGSKRERVCASHREHSSLMNCAEHRKEAHESEPLRSPG
eukprot:1147316-Pelagomonas_calceolata.AAC.2